MTFSKKMPEAVGFRPGDTKLARSSLGTVLLIVSMGKDPERLTTVVQERLREFSVVAQLLRVRGWLPKVGRLAAEFERAFAGAPAIVIEEGGRGGKISGIASGIADAAPDLPVLGVPMAKPLGTKSAGGVSEGICDVKDAVESVERLMELMCGTASNRSVGWLAVGEAGAQNAALCAIAILALNNPVLRRKLVAFRKRQRAGVLSQKLPTR